jgi:hypothetical protein
VTARALTIVAEIDARGEARARLEAALKAIRDDVTGNAVLRPAELPATHFTRWLILSDDDPVEPHPDLLVWESNFDGDLHEYLTGVVAVAPAGIDALFDGCAGYPEGGAVVVPEEVVGWLRARTVRSQAFYAAYRRISRAQVVNDGKVRVALGEVLDHERAALVLDKPRAVQARLRAYLAGAHPELDATDDGDGKLGILLGRVAAVLVLAVVALPFFWIWLPLLLLVRRAELRDNDQIQIDAPVHDEGGHHRVEDRVMQNQLTHVVDVKGGLVRIAALWVTLNVIGLLARTFYVDGALHGMTTIHFARWVILFDRRDAPRRRRHRLLFFSNYDGSWDAYLGEFIDRGSKGLTAIWSNTEGFPRTRWLIDEGSRDEEAFKQWARRRQRPSLPGEAQAWWSGIPSSTVANVRDAADARRRVNRRLDDEEISEWLRRL